MRVRVRKKPWYTTYYVETKKWYQFRWHVVDDFHGTEAFERALAAAKEWANPQITLISKGN